MVKVNDKIEKGDFLEWADVHGKRYGTGRSATEAFLTQGHDVFFDIDYQGGFQIRDAMDDAVELQRRIAEEGYLFVRRLQDPDKLRALRREMMSAVQEAG